MPSELITPLLRVLNKAKQDRGMERDSRSLFIPDEAGLLDVVYCENQKFPNIMLISKTQWSEAPLGKSPKSAN